MEVGTALTQLTMFITGVGGAVAIVWQAGDKLGRFANSLDHLSKAVERMANLPERVTRVEAKVERLDRLLDNED